MSWDDVEVDFGGEETANFGPRQESGTALFQVDTLATISPRGEVIINPTIHAACGTQGFCAVADCQVSLFDETCHNLYITLSFGSDVDVVAWSDDSMFLVVAERRGVINFVDTQLKTTLLSQSLLSRDQNDRSKCFQQMCFVPGRKSGTCELVVLASDGSLFRFSNINLVKLNQAIDAQDMKLAKQIQEEIVLDQTDTSNLHTEGAYFFTTAHWQGKTHIVTCGKGSSVAAIWKCDKDTITLARSLGDELFDGVGVVQCRVSTNGKWLFLLDEEHTLSVFDPRTLLLIGYWPDIEIQQFILMNYNSVNTGIKNSGSQPELQLVVLTPGPEYFLKVFTVPGMQCTYSLAVSKYCTLAEVLPSQEPIFLLEGSYKEYLSDVISVLMVRCLTEALPEARFNRLLHKKKFEEAEKFARQFQLDVELVYKVKTTDLLEKASPWTKYPAEEGQNLCDELKACMEQITDITFVVENCVQAALPTPETMYDMLRYAKQRLQKEDSTPATNQGSTLAQLATKVLNVTHRLESFQMVYSNNAYSANQWDLFLRADMLEELLKWLTLGHLTEADIIWKRHKPEFQGDITEDILQQLLTAIPENMHSTELVILLQQDVIPFVIHRFPMGKRPLAKWMEEKAKSMEISEKDDWPKNSLKFAELFFTTNQDTRLSPAQYTTELTSKTTCTAGASELWELVQKLRALLHLRTKYNCRMPLAEYDRETTGSIVFRMLDRVVAPELIPTTIENIARPYMKENNLSEEKLLLQYIEDLLEHIGKQAVYTYESSWEAKAIAVINCIQDLEYHIMGIFTIMSYANMPWSQALEKIIHDGLALKHPKVSDLKGRYDLLQLKKMLTKYELTQHNVLDTNTAQSVMRYIIHQDKPDSLQDALKVVVAYTHMSPADAYLFQIRFLVKKNRIEEVLNLLKTLPVSEAKFYCKRMVIWAEVTLQSTLSSIDQQCIQETEFITQAAVTLLNFLLGVTDDSEERFGLEQLQMDLKCILALQTEYGEFLSLPSFRDESVRKSLLKKYLIKFYTNQDCNSGISGDKTSLGGERKSRNDKHKKNFNKIARLGEVLRFSPSELRGQLAITAAKTGEVQTAIRMAKDLSSEVINAAVAKTLYIIVHTLCKLWAEENPKLLTAVTSPGSTLMIDMSSLAHRAATHCSQDLLCDCLELCKHLRLASSVYHQCEGGDYGITVQTTTSSSTTKDPYRDWPFDDFFKEDTLVMDSSVAMPMVHQLTMTCLPLAKDEDERLPLQQSRIGGREFVTTIQEEKEEDTKASIPELPFSHSEIASSSAMELIQHLQENNQYETALKVLVVSLGACLQHFVANTIKLELCNKEQASKEQQLVIDIGKMSVERLKMYTSTTLMKICGSRYVDCSLGLGYTCILAKQTALDTLKALTKGAGQNYRKLLAIATIGEAFAHINNETQVLELCQKLITSAKWGKRLAKLKIATNDVFTTHDVQSKRQLLPQIVKQPNVDVNLIKEYCRAFNILEVNEALLCHLDMLLVPNNRGTDGPGEINMAAIQSVLSSIIDQDLLVHKLSEAIDKVDSYDYERLKFLMEQIQQRRTEATSQNLHNVDLGLKILSALALYTRKFEPSQYELDFHCTTEEEQLRGIRGRLSPYAKTRLPYHPLLQGGQWKILSRELNEDTVHELLHICNLLRLPADQVYVVTIQNVLNRYKDNRPSIHRPGGDAPSKTMVIDIKVLEKVQKLLLCIADPNMATATARMVAKELPLGPEKVLALKICEMLACHAIDKCPENSPERQKAQLLHQKLSVVYRAVATEQILHKSHLASQTLLSLVETPARLIFMLYEHSSIQERKLGKQQDLPDIHAAAYEIAAVNKLDIQKIWLRLVDMWLPHPSASKQADDDMTMNMSLVSLDESSHTEEEKSLKRVVYVLQTGDIKTNAKFLLNYAFKVESSKITNACRVRALRCLFTLQDAEEIEQSALKPVKVIREYMKNLLYLCKLEHLNITMDLEAFVTVDKEGLVRGLWRNHSRNQKAVRLVADLCIDYKIHDSQLWNSILLQLIQFNMMDFLHHVLSSLAAIPELWQIQCLPRAWRSVLLAPFTAVCAPLTQEQEENCRQSAILLQSCPMAMSLDLMSLCKQFIKVEMFAEALGCLLYIPDPEKKQTQIQSLLGCQCHIAILDEIAKVEQHEKQMPQGEKIQAAIFNHLSETDNYNLLQGTKHFARMVNYFVKTKDIGGLLKRALIAQRLSDAVDIVNMYTSLHPDTPSIQGAFGQQVPGTTKLRSYLKTHRLDELLQYVPKEPRQYKSETS